MLDNSLIVDYLQHLADAAELKPVETASSYVFYCEETIVPRRRGLPRELFGDHSDESFTVICGAMPGDLPDVWMRDDTGGRVRVEVYDGRFDGSVVGTRAVGVEMWGVE